MSAPAPATPAPGGDPLRGAAAALLVGAVFVPALRWGYGGLRHWPVAVPVLAALFLSLLLLRWVRAPRALLGRYRALPGPLRGVMLYLAVAGGLFAGLALGRLLIGVLGI